MDDGSEIQDYLQEKTGQRTVPNIFISEHFGSFLIYFTQRLAVTSFSDQKHVGGCDAVVALDSSGKLNALVAA